MLIRNTLNAWGLGLFTFLICFLSSCDSEKTDTTNGVVFNCGAEQTVQEGEKTWFDNNGNRFEHGETQSEAYARSGKYASKVTKENRYGTTLKIPNATGGQYISASVWRKSISGRAELVVADMTGKKLYKYCTIAQDYGDDGWERLEVTAVLPESMQDETVQVFVKTVDGESYFDDLRVHYNPNFSFPEYPEEDGLDIHIPAETYALMDSIRKVAVARGTIESKDKKYFSATVNFKGKTLPIKLRFKGDHTDHMQDFKWSFRIKVRGDNSIMGMKSFSIQSPDTRDFLKEWTIHRLFNAADVLTTRFEYIPVKVNNQALGVYAIEEHFEKQLVESKNRREGPIIKFNEDGFWEVVNQQARTKKWEQVPFYLSAQVEPFKSKKTTKSPTLSKQFEHAQSLMNQLRRGTITPTEAFDVERLASYFALVDLGKVVHGAAWHNQRWYYNPVLGKLEPIGYDCYSDHGINPERSTFLLTDKQKQVKQKVLPEKFLNAILFKDSLFLAQYEVAMRRFTSEEFLNAFEQDVKADLVHSRNMLLAEFPDYPHDSTFFARNAKQILADWSDYKVQLEQLDIDVKVRNFTNGPAEPMKNVAIKAYAQSKGTSTDPAVLGLLNFHSEALEVFAVGSKKSMDTLPKPLLLPAYAGAFKEVVVELPVAKIPKKVYFRIPGQEKLYDEGVMKWPYHWKETPAQRTFNNVVVANTKYYTVNGTTISFKAGTHTIAETVIIPEGYQVQFEGGTQLFFEQGGAFMSKSPVKMIGTAEKPIVIGSKDGTARGFTVIQAPTQSVLEHVHFSHMNTWQYDGWGLTGMVTFYESDVTLSNCSFMDALCEDGLNLVRSKFSLDASAFAKTFSDAFDADFCQGTLTNTTFKECHNDAIDFSGSQISISDVVIDSPGDKGISGGEASTLEIANVSITNSPLAVASKDLSQLTIKQLTLKDCALGFAAFQKKPEYGSATIAVEGLTQEGIKELHVVETGSRLTIDAQQIDGTRDISNLGWYE